VRIAADHEDQRHDFSVRKQILWKSDTATRAEARAIEIQKIRELGANERAIGYNLTPKPRWPVKARPIDDLMPEPPDGSVIRFTMANHYHYLAIRQGDIWATTAGGYGRSDAQWLQDRSSGAIAPRTSWIDLESQRESTTFEVATSWDKVADPDVRVRKSRKVIRFTVAGHRVAAIRLYRYESDPGVWCSTLTQEESDSLPGDGFGTWLDIRRYGSDVEVATSWTDMS
jgi:hypothetical protein